MTWFHQNRIYILSDAELNYVFSALYQLPPTYLVIVIQKIF
jgi:hypothetical protein